jgi:hypothetical protein
MEELAEAMLNSGTVGGIVYNYDADTVGVAIGNDRLMKDITIQKQLTPQLDLTAAYTIVPSCTHETVPVNELPEYMKENGFNPCQGF